MAQEEVTLMSIEDPTRVGVARVEDSEASGLRVLASFLDLCLPLDPASQILVLTDAPAPSAGDVLAALDRAIAHEVQRGGLVQAGTDENGDPVYDMPERRPRPRYLRKRSDMRKAA